MRFFTLHENPLTIASSGSRLGSTPNSPSSPPAPPAAAPPAPLAEGMTPSSASMAEERIMSDRRTVPAGIETKWLYASGVLWGRRSTFVVFSESQVHSGGRLD